MRSILAVSMLALAAACASTTTTEPVTVDTPPVAEVTEPTAFELAMSTVDDLIAAGNEQAAILRLEQLIGMQEASDEERAQALLRKGELQFGEGSNVWGAIDSFEELINTYPDSELVDLATVQLDIARGEATSLNGRLESDPDLSPTERFEILFRLGQHQDAADLMLDRNLSPENKYLLDFYQIGYLCDDETLSGPAYQLTEPDGTERELHFCDFGK